MKRRGKSEERDKKFAREERREGDEKNGKSRKESFKNTLEKCYKTTSIDGFLMWRGKPQNAKKERGM
jgi:hypothetical protein